MKKTTINLAGAWIVAILLHGATAAQATLIHYFPFDGTVNNAIAGGVVATNQGATFTGAQVAPGIGSAQSAQLTSGTDRIIIDSAADRASLQNLFHNDFTLSVWTRSEVPGTAVSGGGIAYVFDFGTSHNTGFGIGFDQSHGKWNGGGRIGGYYTSTTLGGTGNPVGQANQWYHLAVTRTGSVMRLYIDGVLFNTVTVSSPNVDVANPFVIGSEAKANQRRWDGQVDDLGMFNVALSDGQIASIRNVADTPGLDYNLSVMSGLFGLHALGAGGGQTTVDGLTWAYNDSPFLASLGAGGVGQLSNNYYINFDGASGLVGVGPIIPEPGTFVLLAAGTVLLTARRRRART